MNPVDAMEQLTKQLGRFKTNAEFIKLIQQREWTNCQPLPPRSARTGNLCQIRSSRSCSVGTRCFARVAV